MKKKELIKKLNSLQHKIKPDQDWKVYNREILLSQIKAQTRLDFSPKSNKIWGAIIGNQLVKVSVRSFATLCAVFLIIFGSWIATVSATKNSLPGDLLYGLKLTTERVQVNLTLDDEKKTNLELEFADRRLDEVRQVMADNDSQTKDANLDVALSKFQENLDNVKSNLAKLEIKDTEKAVKLANLLETKSGEYVDALKEHGQSSPELGERTEQAITASKATADKALSVIINEYESGQSDLSLEEVVSKLNKRISKIEEDASQARDSISKIITNKKIALEDQTAQEDAENESTSETSAENPEEEDVQTADEQIAEQESEEEITVDTAEDQTEEDTSTDEQVESADNEATATTTGSAEENQEEAEEPAEELPTIEDIQTKPAEIQPLLDEAKQLIGKREIGPAFDKIKQADEILTIINKVITANRQYLPQEEQSTDEEQPAEEINDNNEDVTAEEDLGDEQVNDEQPEQDNPEQGVAGESAEENSQSE